MAQKRFDFAKYTFLVVDDHEDSLMLAMEILKHCGGNVLSARDTQEARDLLQKAKPDAIVTDINLPRETGLQFAEWVRQHGRPEIRNTAILAITAMSPSVTLVPHPAIDAFIRKPMYDDELCELLERVITERTRHER
jgi:two-component system chemotaxis response regulator CheY